MTDERLKRIPYGQTDFEMIRRNGELYVDRTRFIELIEEASNFNFLIRPRRFGKSLFLAMLHAYYDILKADDFGEIFGGTWIGSHPTPERNSSLVMTLNFSAMNPRSDDVRDSFAAFIVQEVRHFLDRYADQFTDDQIQSIVSASDPFQQLSILFQTCGTLKYKTYLLIDEYDNFTNTILSNEGETAYESLTHGEGFFRHFFNVLKKATTGSDSGLTRMFITGVSPVTLDDVTSGFNIGNNLSLDPGFESILGFTRDEVRGLLDYYKPAIAVDIATDDLLAAIEPWYGNYRFTPDTEMAMFNTDLVLFFLLKAVTTKRLPRDWIDNNVRIDYRKLKHLVILGNRLNGNFRLLNRILEDGEVYGDVMSGFPVSDLTKQDPFLSLLYYFGLLTFNGESRGRSRLVVPNQTIKTLMYSYLREAHDDAGNFQIDVYAFANLVKDMAYDGAWESVFDFLAVQIERQTSIRDYLVGEKVVQTFILAYLNIVDVFITMTERECAHGYADMVLQPFWAKYPDCPFGYLIELKYIPRGEFSEAVLAERIAEAKSQLDAYQGDDTLTKLMGQATIKRLILVYSGWECVYRDELV